MAFIKYDTATRTNRGLKYPNKNYRIHMYDSPPWNFLKDRRANYLGELDHWTDFNVKSEINSLNNSAEIRYTPQVVQSTPAVLTEILADVDGVALTWNNQFLQIFETQTNPLSSTPFQDTPLDYGVFISIENTELTGTTTRDHKTIFYGVVSSWEQDLATQQVIVRLQGMSSIAGNYLAADMLFNNPYGSDIVHNNVPQVRVNYAPYQAESDGTLVRPSAYDNFLLASTEPGKETTLVRIMEWMLFYNPLLELAPQAVVYIPVNRDTANESFVALANLSANEDDASFGLKSPVVINITDRNVNDVLAEVWEHSLPEWVYYIDYDREDLNTRSGNYEDNAYKPRLVLRKGAVWNTPSATEPDRMIPDYTLTRGVHITAQSINFSGEKHYSRVVVASQPQSRLTITELPAPSTTSQPVIKHRREDQDWRRRELTNNAGEGTDNYEWRQEPGTDYTKRIVADFPKSETLAGDTGFYISGIPYRTTNTAKILNKLGDEVDFNYVKTAPIEVEQDLTPGGYANYENQGIPGATTLKSLLSRRDRAAKQSWTPQYTGTIKVIDAEDRPLDSYQLGDQIAFTGFNSILDNVVARIVGINRNSTSASLSLSFVLPTINRRLWEIENQARNRRHIN